MLSIKTALCAGLVVGAPCAAAQLSFSFDEVSFASMSNAFDDYSAYATPGGVDLPIPVADGTTFLGDFGYKPIGSEAGFGELEVRAAGSTEPASENSLFGFLDGDPAFSFAIEAVGGPMNAIGFNFTSADSLGGTILTFDNGESFRVADVLGNPGTGFLGITSATSFNSVTFEVADAGSFEGIFIETIYADVVPSPATGSLLAFAGVVARRRR